MDKKRDKPSAEAKALSLFLMAFKSKSPEYKVKSKRINKQWRKVTMGDVSQRDYLKEVQVMLTSCGGYQEVLEKTVKHYIKKTGLWSLKGDDKYCKDAQQVADRLLKK